MSKSVIYIMGKIDRILKENVDGVIVLFKNIPNHKKLKETIFMVNISKKQWNKLKDIKDKENEEIRLIGEMDVRTKNTKPHIYVECIDIIRTKKINNRINKILNKKNVEIIEKNEPWFNLIPQEQFKKIDINKVRLIEGLHLNSVTKNINMQMLSRIKHLNPIAVKLNEDGEYELITGIKSYIVAKLLSRNVKAYITDLDINIFRTKYKMD